MKKLILISALLLVASNGWAYNEMDLGRIKSLVTFKGPYDDETVQQRDARMAWWREARFGLFIHWGVYAVPAGTYKGEQIPNIGEWIMHYAQIPVAEYPP